VVSQAALDGLTARAAKTAKGGAEG
jgi:hypothetical protein